MYFVYKVVISYILEFIPITSPVISVPIAQVSKLTWKPSIPTKAMADTSTFGRHASCVIYVMQINNCLVYSLKVV